LIDVYFYLFNIYSVLRIETVMYFNDLAGGKTRGSGHDSNFSGQVSEQSGLLSDISGLLSGKLLR